MSSQDTAMSLFEKSRTAWAAAAAAALAVSLAVPARAATSGASVSALAAPSVSVRSASGAYRIEGSFGVETPAGVVWAVLTDYDRVSSFVASMRSSVAQRESGRLLVTQEAVGRVGPFARTMHVVLEVTEQATERISFRDVGGSSFHSYVGSWTISPEGAGVRVTYVLDARPRSSPPLFAKSIMSSNARVLLEQVRLEILRRDRVESSAH
jgi:carbon monoxide dehydrogenase subunit G